MRNLKFATGEHYHLFSRGNQKQQIFFDDSDRIRFIFLLLHCQSNISPDNIYRQTSAYKKNNSFSMRKSNLNLIIQKRNVELVNFCLMPNHFHASVSEINEGGISKYMHKVLMSYAKYFCKKYKRTGHVFESTFKAVHVKSNTQLLHLSSYIHRNPREMKEWRGKEHTYPWSSLIDYTNENRWGELLKRDIVLGQFETKEGYKNFVDTSTTKTFGNILPADHLILEEE